MAVPMLFVPQNLSLQIVPGPLVTGRIDRPEMFAPRHDHAVIVGHGDQIAARLDYGIKLIQFSLASAKFSPICSCARCSTSGFAAAIVRQSLVGHAPKSGLLWLPPVMQEVSDLVVW